MKIVLEYSFKNLKKLLVILSIGLLNTVFAQENENKSHEAYAIITVKKELNRLDSNKNGKYEKNENEKTWK